MRILMIPSFSMRSYTKDEWLLTRDAHYTQAEALGKRWARDGHEIEMVIPYKSDVHGGQHSMSNDWYTPLVHVGYGHNIADQRRDLFWMDVIDLEDKGYDVIFCGHPEYGSALRIMYPNAAIATILTHGPLATWDYLESIGSSLDASDVIFYNFSERLLPVTFTLHYVQKLRKLYCYADGDIGPPIESEPRGDRVFFLSRLSDPNRFDYDKMRRILTSLSATMTVTCGDPSEAGTLPEGTHYFSQRSKQFFLERLRRVRYAIVPYQMEHTYSVSYFEALACGCQVLTMKGRDHFHPLNSQLNFESIDAIPGIIQENWPSNSLELFNKAEVLGFYVNDETANKVLNTILGR